MLKKIITEPLVHFLLLSLCLFGVYELLNPSMQTGPLIEISEGRIAQLNNRFRKTWQRDPTEEETAALIRRYALDEIYSREARALGLDINDSVVKQRLRQKMEFLVQDTVPEKPSGQELENYYLENRDKYRPQTRYSFTQIFISRDRDQQDLEAIIKRTDKQLASGQIVDGDSTLLPRQLNAASANDISRQFGRVFAQALEGMETEQWHGPVESGLGIHFVKLDDVEHSSYPSLKSVYPMVLNDWKYAKIQENQMLFEKELLERYEIKVTGLTDAEAL